MRMLAFALGLALVGPAAVSAVTRIEVPPGPIVIELGGERAEVTAGLRTLEHFVVELAPEVREVRADGASEVRVEIVLVDRRSLPVATVRELVLELATSLGTLDRESVEIPAGGHRGEFRLVAGTEVGLATVLAYSDTSVGQATIAFTPEAGPAPVAVELGLDDDSAAAGAPLALTVTLLDRDGNPTPTEEPRTALVRFLGGGSGRVQSFRAAPGDVVDFPAGMGPATVELAIPAGRSNVGFGVRFPEGQMRRVDATLTAAGGAPPLSAEPAQVAIYEVTDPSSVFLAPVRGTLQANGTDSTTVEVMLTLRGADALQTAVPACPESMRDLDLLATASDGELYPARLQVTAASCPFASATPTLTSSRTPGAVALQARTVTDLRGRTEVRYELADVPPVDQVVAAVVGGAAGSVLMLIASLARRRAGGSRAHWADMWIARPLMGGVLLVALYYAAATFGLPYHTGVAFAAVVGLVGGYLGLALMAMVQRKVTGEQSE